MDPLVEEAIKELLREGAKWLLRESPPERAIASTAAAFNGLALDRSLAAWCTSEDFRAVLEAVQRGEPIPPLRELATSFITRGGFHFGIREGDYHFGSYQETLTIAEFVLAQFFEFLTRELQSRHGRPPIVLHQIAESPSFEEVMSLVEMAEHNLTGSNQSLWLGILDLHLSRIRGALAVAAQDNDPESRLRLAISMTPYWEVRGQFSEGRRWLRGLLVFAHDLDAGLAVRGLNALATLAYRQSDYEIGRRASLVCLPMALRKDDDVGAARALNAVGLIDYRMAGSYRLERARNEFDASRRLAAQAGDLRDEAYATMNLGRTYEIMAAHDLAVQWIDTSLSLWAELDDGWGYARSLDELAVAVGLHGDQATERRLHEESLTMRLRLGDVQGIAISSRGLAQSVRDRDPDEARELLLQSADKEAAVEDWRGLSVCFEELASISLSIGDVFTADELARRARILREVIRAPILRSGGWRSKPVTGDWLAYDAPSDYATDLTWEAGREIAREGLELARVA